MTVSSCERLIMTASSNIGAFFSTAYVRREHLSTRKYNRDRSLITRQLGERQSFQPNDQLGWLFECGESGVWKWFAIEKLTCSYDCFLVGWKIRDHLRAYPPSWGSKLLNLHISYRMSMYWRTNKSKWVTNRIFHKKKMRKQYWYEYIIWPFWRHPIWADHMDYLWIAKMMGVIFSTSSLSLGPYEWGEILFFRKKNLFSLCKFLLEGKKKGNSPIK